MRGAAEWVGAGIVAAAIWAAILFAVYLSLGLFGP
jgi:hypothetical protein